MEKILKEVDAGEEKIDQVSVKKTEKEYRKINHMEESMNKENDWDHLTAASMVEDLLKMLPKKK